MKKLVYSLYSIQKQNFTMKLLSEGHVSDMKSMMNSLRHSQGKEFRYAVYYGNQFISSTCN